MTPYRGPVILHLQHSWGGGLETWVRDFNNGDRSTRQLVLKSIGNWGKFGEGLLLYDHVDAEHPLRYWNLGEPIKATAVTHPRYQAAFAEIVREYGVTHLFVSSLIGHSLDVLRGGLPALHVLHDYYPICPALNVFYGGVCESCDLGRLQECSRNNPHNRFFLNVPPDEWLELRRAYLSILEQQGARLIAPTEGVQRNLLRLTGSKAYQQVQVIPHGIDGFTRIDYEEGDGARLRLVIPGLISENKGARLLDGVLGEIVKEADVLLLGCGDEAAQRYGGIPGVEVVPRYLRTELDDRIMAFAPHCALLAATVPETFSYMLSELLALGVPVVATRIGSFADRILDGENGFLVEPDSTAILRRIRGFVADRAPLRVVRERIRSERPRGIREMIDDYYDLLGLSVIAEQQPGTLAHAPPLRPLPARMSTRVVSWLLAQHIRVHDRITAAGQGRSLRGRWLLAGYRLLTLIPRRLLRWAFRA